MKYEDYKAQHPALDPGVPSVVPNPQCPEYLRVGMLQFTPETACSWGGPFSGDVACFILMDLRLNPLRWTLPSFEQAQDLAEARVLKWLAAKPKHKGDTLALLDRILAGEPEAIHFVNERGTQDHPFRLWVFGNDDTSYSKWFRTLEEAEALIELLEAAEPLDYMKDFMPFGWVFTN